MTITYRKIKQILVALFLSGVSLVVIFVILLAIPAVDDWLCHKIEKQLTTVLGHSISIEELQYFPLRTISLRGVKLLDNDSSAIATASRIKASIDITSILSSKLSLSQLDIDSLRLYITQVSENPALYNFSHLMANDSITELYAQGDTVALYEAFGITDLNIREAEVYYTPLNAMPHTIKGLNARIEDVALASEEVNASVSRIFMLLDGSGSFLTGDFSIRKDTLKVNNVKSFWGNSIANIESLRIDRFTSLDSLLEDTPQSPAISAKISLLSLSEFQELPKTSLSGSLSVSNDSIKADNLNINILEKNKFTLNADIAKWKTPEQSVVDIVFSNINLNPKEILAFSGNKLTPTVDSLLHPMSGKLTLKGQADNIAVNSVLSGNVSSLILDSRIKVKSSTLVDYEGTVASSFSPGRVSTMPIGNTTAVVDFVGTYSTNPNLTYVHCKGNAPLATILGYQYHDVQIECMSKQDSQSALLDVKDKNGSLKTVALVEKTGAYPHYDITINADTLQLGKLGLVSDLPNSFIDCKARLTFDGTDIDNAEGTMIVDNLSFHANKDTVSLGHLNINMHRQTESKNRSVVLESDKLKANAEGRFAVKDLWAELQSQLHGSSPSLVARPARTASTDTWMAFELYYNDIQSLAQLVDTNLVVTGGGRVSANVDASDHTSDLSVRMEQISYADQGCEGLTFDYRSSASDSSEIVWSTKTTRLATLGNIGSFHNKISLSDDKLSTNFQWVRRQGDPGGDVSLQCLFDRDKTNELTSHLSIDTSFIVLGKRRWEIAKSSAVLTPQSLQVDGFAMIHDDRSLRVDGKSSKANPSDTLTVRINKFAISDVLTTSPEDKFSLDGDVSALAFLSDIYGNVIINCKSSIDNLVVDGDNLEHMDIETDWQPENKNLDLHLGITTKGRQCVDANGQLDIARGNMYLNFDIDSLSIGFLNFYLDAAIENMQGTTSGKLQLHGPLEDIKLDARLCVHHSTFSVKQTYVNYIIDQNDSIILSPSRMDFRQVRFRDRYGKQGIFRGFIAHNMFSNLNLFIDFDVNDMLVLDTQEKNNPSYYGTVYGNGYFGIRGTTSLTKLIVQAHTSPNSVFYILPLTKSEIGQTDYIRFANNKTNDQGKEEEKTTEEFDLQKQQEGVEAVLEVDIRPNAKIYAIVDPRSDNMVEARGQGTINVEMTREGALLMEGTYVMEQGAYNFNLQNIVNKKFDIRKGSTVMWNGDPYDAVVDLVATYKTRASLYDLVQNSAEESTADLKKRVPINCNLFLTEHLLNPKIRFEIEIPSSQNFSQYMFDQYVNTEEEMNRQVFSLLLAGRFYASQEAQSNATNATGGASTSNYLGTTLSELMSNQFSNWISQNKYNVGMGVNYRPGDEVTNEEYEVAVQTGVLDNKIILSGNIGYGRDVSSENNKEGSLIGDFDVEVKLNKSETLRAKAYTHSNNDVIYETSPTTQGIGISYQESFDTFRELLHKYFGWMRRKKQTEEKQVEQEEQGK